MSVFRKDPTPAERLAKLQEKLARYPKPFRCKYFVNKLEVLDGNYSELSHFADQVADALNLICECQIREVGR